ncbi:hypothetical protein ACFHYQ_08970 [Sphaerimonospora cavernae]|uniref:HprK-related kinase B n=1 Tax=Sphaerimonospora cavernae TaxID=1740611 RepID=A0ABV6U1V2_9ACTN
MTTDAVDTATGTRNAVYALGEVRVAVATDHAPVLAYLGDFYARTDAGRPWWLVDGRLEQPHPGMTVDSYGVGYLADQRQRRLLVRAADPENLQISVRKAIREVMVAFCEDRGYAMLHASAVHRDGLLIVFAGDKGAGKTTLALDAVVRHGFDYISNDHLIVYRDPGLGGLVVTSLPTPIPVKIGTYLAMEDVLPVPWNTNGVDVDSYRRWPTAELRRLDTRLDYTFASFGQPNPVAVHCGVSGTARVVVVLPEYAPDGIAAEPQPGGSASDLLAHLRIDWVFDPVHNPRHLPYPRRAVERFTADGQDLISVLCADARMMRWAHTGQVAPLLHALDGGGAE